MAHGSHVVYSSQPSSWKLPSVRHACRMATISACAVGSFVAVTRFVPSPMTLPSLTITHANGLRARSARFPSRAPSPAACGFCPYRFEYRCDARRQKSVPCPILAQKTALGKLARNRNQGRMMVWKSPKAEGAMVQIENVGRRGFLKGMLGAGAFVLSVRLMPTQLFAAGSAASVVPAKPTMKGPFAPGVYLAIDTD